jgi:hypothetical protein
MADPAGPLNRIGLNAVQRSFLKALDLSQQLGLTMGHPTAIKLYNDVVQRGRTDPITEADLAPDERAQLRDLVLAHSERNNQTAGSVDYKDYFEHKSPLDQNILGGFRYSIGDNGIKVRDTYDFNKNREGAPIERNPFIQAAAAFANPRGLAAQIGRDVIPDTGGQGIPVDITLPR